MKVWSGVVVLLVAASASAQLASDVVPHERTLPIREQIRMQLEDSRYHFGIFRLQPQFAIRGLGYDNNVFGTSEDEVGDWHSTVSSGLRVIVPAGSKLYFRGTATPEYTYYKKLRNRRSFGGNYEASVLGLYNHMTVEAGAGVVKGMGPVNSEVDHAALQTSSNATGKIEVDVFGRISVFGSGESRRQGYSATSDEIVRDVSAKPLARTDTVGRGGLRYRFSSYFDISAAVEKTRTDFRTNSARDNTSEAVLVGIRYAGVRSFLNLSAGSRRGEARFLGSAFPRYSTTTGSYYASHELTVGIVVDAYGHRGLGYSLTPENPYFLETSNGGGIVLPLGLRFALRAFGEAGTSRYPLPVNSIKRTDDRKTWGGGVAARLYRGLVLTAIASQTTSTSNLPGLDRSIFRVTTLISLRGGLFR